MWYYIDNLRYYIDSQFLCLLKYIKASFACSSERKPRSLPLGGSACNDPQEEDGFSLPPEGGRTVLYRYVVVLLHQEALLLLRMYRYSQGSFSTSAVPVQYYVVLCTSTTYTAGQHQADYFFRSIRRIPDSGTTCVYERERQQPASCC